MSPEIKIFVDQKNDITNKVIISPGNAQILGVSNGEQVEVFNPDNYKNVYTIVEISDQVLDFAGKFSGDIIRNLEYSGVELIVRKITQQAQQPQQFQQPQIPQPQIPQPYPQPVRSYPTSPMPAQAPSPTPPRPYQAPSPTPPRPYQAPYQSAPGPQQPAGSVETYPNRTSADHLKKQKNGIAVRPVVSTHIIGGRVQISSNTLKKLGLGQGMLIAWEDPLTRATGSARVDESSINDDEIRMSRDTKEDTHIQSDKIVIYSTEPPISKAEQIMLQVDSRGDLQGYCMVSPRIQHTLTLQNNDILQFEDELTGAIGAGKVQISESAPDNSIVIDSEILEASGIGSYEVKVSKNHRQIIPLQNISLGISPIAGENMWELISIARQNIVQLKQWLSNYIIFKGIKLRWNVVNLACSILDCVPDLSGDILASITENTTLTLSPMGLIPFNAILIIDISRSMMARDVYVTNIAPAIEGIKAAMESREIQEFLKNFKDGINIPRRISAAFAAVLFLSEKVGRGFGEKVAVIRFADEAQILPFGNSYYMDSASGKKGILEESARMIVDRIGNAYGQSTAMGDAMVKAMTIMNEFNKINANQPTMIVMLTDGVPTDGDAFFTAIQQFSTMTNVIVYIVGLGNPDDELMSRAASLCGGEYFKPEDAGELLVWYSKRARDLSVKLKAHTR